MLVSENVFHKFVLSMGKPLADVRWTGKKSWASNGKGW
jgi:hypothetical protein